MKHRNLKKKVSAILLAAAMAVAAVPQPGNKAYASEQPDISQFATAGELTTFNTNDNDGAVNPAKVYFGENGSGSSQEWWIVGKDSSDGGGLVLFAANPLTSTVFSSSYNEKTYNGDTVYANHYRASDLFNTLRELEANTAYFSAVEQELMMNTKIYTEDKRNGGSYSTTEKLYAVYGNVYDMYATAGTNSSSDLNGGLKIDLSYWGTDVYWLRAPYSDSDFGYISLLGYPGNSVSYIYVNDSNSVVPAFQLKLSSVLFGSTALNAKSDGQLTANEAFTLRYQGNVGNATISQSKQSIVITNITDENTYLVVQNNEGAWAKKVTDNDFIFASEMSESLTSFENCKVWLETTDSSERITYATMATQGNGHSIKINAGDTMSASEENKIQTDVTGSIDAIIIHAKDGYMFPADYTVAEQDGIKVTRNSENQITVSGTPTSDVNITLPPATKKDCSMVSDGNGTFSTVCEDYQPITANAFTVKNTGNVDLENVGVSITGKDADKFELEWDNTSAISPNGTLKITVKPKDDLDIGTYQATLSISADNVNTVTTDLKFIVSEHDYNAVVTPPDCTEKGYTTYTCKNCTHSYISDETDATGHNFGKWKVIKEATTTTTGEKERTCERCDAKETEVIPVISNADTDSPNNPNADTDTNNPNNPNNPDNSNANTDKDNNKSDTTQDSPKTGDNTNPGLYASLFATSGLFLAILAVLRKRKKLHI